MNNHEKEIERFQINAVFGLGGGELADEPWTVKDGDREIAYPYHYDGLPEYLEHHGDYPDHYATGVQYRTLIACGLYGAPGEVLIDSDGTTWKRIQSYPSSGETDCPGTDDDADDEAECPLCGDTGTHGMVCIGEGWAEWVYRSSVVHLRETDSRKIACGYDAVKAYRPEDLTADIELVTCEDCKYAHDEACAERAEQEYRDSGPMPESDPDRFRWLGYQRFACEETGEPYGSFEIFHSDSADLTNEDGERMARGFYWVAGFPGCLWDGDPMGPFDTAREAFDDASGWEENG